MRETRVIGFRRRVRSSELLGNFEQNWEKNGGAPVVAGAKEGKKNGGAPVVLQCVGFTGKRKGKLLEKQGNVAEGFGHLGLRPCPRVGP